MSKGLLVEVYRQRNGDCTNGGASSKHDSFILTGTNPENHKAVYGPFEPNHDCPELVLVSGPYGNARAVPRDLLESKAWVMFGGNFVYTSDSRFPSEAPIKIFDRVEA